MKEQIDSFLGSTARLQEIRVRMDAIEKERRALEEEAAQILARFGVTAAPSTSGEWKDPRLRLPRRIMSFLAAHPAEQFRVATIAAALGITNKRQIGVVRAAVTRLECANRILRTAYGYYAYKAGAV